MKVLVACEESQEVCKAFREKGHEAYSCDIQPCSGGHPEWHIKGDVLPILNGNCNFITEGGQWIIIDGRWDLIIAHPPCTYLTGVGNRHFSLRVTDAEKVVKRWQDRCEAVIFFMQCALADCDRIAVENPIGFMGHWRKPDQVINPYQFAESVDDSENYQMKTTCLWLKNLPKLRTNKLPKPLPVKEYVNISGKIKRRYFEENHGVIDGEKHGGNDSKARSRTFSGVARAMADAWG